MNLLETILTNTYTKADLTHRTNLLREFLEYQYFTPHANSNFIFLLNEFFIAKNELRDEFNALMAWGQDFISLFTRENMYAGLKEISDGIAKLPTVTLFLPFIPPIYEVPKLCGWFRGNVGGDVLVDIKNNQELIGGCAVVWKGVYRDFSLRYYMSLRKEAITKVVGDYLENYERTP